MSEAKTEAFEEWAKREGYGPSMLKTHAWLGWQAAYLQGRREALEEAAKAAEEVAAKPDSDWPTGNACAAAIRELSKEKDHG